MFKRLSDDGSKRVGRNGKLESRGGAEPDRVFGAIARGIGKERYAGRVGVFTTNVAEDFETVGIARVDARDDEVEIVLRQHPRGDAIGIGFLNFMSKGLKHRRNQRDRRGFGMNDQNTGVAHRIILSQRASRELRGADASSLRE